MFFDRQYFSLSRFERFLADVVFYCIGAFLLICGLILVSGPGLNLKLGGALILFFFADSFWRIFSGEHRIDSRVIKNLKSGVSIELNKFFKLESFLVLKTAFNRAETAKAGSLLFFVLSELLSKKRIRRIVQRIGVEPSLFEKETEKMIQETSKSALDPVYTDNLKQSLIDELEKIYEQSFNLAMEFNETVVSPESVFIAALSQKTQEMKELISKTGLTISDLKNSLIAEKISREIGARLLKRRALASGKVEKPTRVNRAWTSRPTPYLDNLSNDLTEIARKGWIGFLIGHQNEYQSMTNILSREQRNNVILVGDEEIGKSAMVEHLALNIIKDNVPDKLFDKRLVELELTKVTSGASTSGEIQERFRKMMLEAVDAKNIVLFIRDIHNLALTSAKNELGGFEALEPILNASVIPVVGTTSPRLYRQIIELNPRFKDLFETVKVEELSPEETLRLLVFESFILEKTWNIVISYPALKKITELAFRYLHSRPLPRVSLDLLQEALAQAKQQNKKILTPEMAVDLVSRKTRIPISNAKDFEASTLLNLEAKIHEKLINQEEAVKLVASAMRQYRTGLAREKGPISAFLFVGPTGVGKTELAKVLAGLYFGSEDSMIRFDMSEYQTEESVWSFIGSPDGKIVGNLTEKAKLNPFSLILFDEFEKANLKILELFLPLFDEGSLTDNLGDRVDFRNTIIICTSNAQSNFIKKEIEKGRSVPEFQDELKNKLTEVFKPELLNRFDGVVAFRQLSREEIKKIASLNLEKLKSQILQTQKINLEFSDEVVELVARLGYDPVFGARPLRGVIAKEIKDALAKEILQDNFKSGDSVKVLTENEKTVFQKLS
ncbi:MAG: ATPase AAA-2 domain protein [Parcubacteria group bacterium GW2011_GWA1_Parcubacteria_45_10]|nr:MAG: ATPase AAA-2 domain protein [Parcubacteria group bacterium GW2011_GWA1_Parcubacteria_45_10]KKT88621.1 MAG: ATPase AAA-2 domain protein [Parcubacteria group bacterium GW2011_GWB1_45_10]